MEGLLSLINATEYEGLTIKEWNIVQFSKLSRVLTNIAKEFKDKNVQWQGFSETLARAEGAGVADISGDVLQFLAPFIEQAPVILCVSCNVDAKKLESLTYTDGVVAIMLVLKANLEHLNRFFVKLVAPQVKTEETATMDSTK